MILKWIKRRYTKRMEDSEKVKKITDKLNKESKSTAWDDVTDHYMMPKVTYNALTKTYDVDMSSGVTVKFFVNTETGELRPYWIGKLLKD